MISIYKVFVTISDLINEMAFFLILYLDSSGFLLMKRLCEVPTGAENSLERKLQTNHVLEILLS